MISKIISPPLLERKREKSDCAIQLKEFARLKQGPLAQNKKRNRSKNVGWLAAATW
jgi:hypothetical protein